MAEMEKGLDVLDKAYIAGAQAGPARNMTVTQLAILTYIRKETPVPLKEVADALKVKKPLVSRAMDRFEEQGLAKRHPDPHDRRSVQLGLTHRGRQFLVRAAKNFVRVEQADDPEVVHEDPA